MAVKKSLRGYRVDGWQRPPDEEEETVIRTPLFNKEPGELRAVRKAKAADALVEKKGSGLRPLRRRRSRRAERLRPP